MMIKTVMIEDKVKNDQTLSRINKGLKGSQSLPSLPTINLHTESSDETKVYPNAFIPTLDYLHSQGIE